VAQKLPLKKLTYKTISCDWHTKHYR